MVFPATVRRSSRFCRFRARAALWLGVFLLVIFPATAVASSVRGFWVSNLQQIALAFHSYHDAYRHLPADIVDKQGKPLLSWRVALLPFLEEDRLYREFHLDEPWDSAHNLKLVSQIPPC